MGAQGLIVSGPVALLCLSPLSYVTALLSMHCGRTLSVLLSHLQIGGGPAYSLKGRTPIVTSVADKVGPGRCREDGSIGKQVGAYPSLQPLPRICTRYPKWRHVIWGRWEAIVCVVGIFRVSFAFRNCTCTLCIEAYGRGGHVCVWASNKSNFGF